MVKKCLIAIAVVALLATTVQAATNPIKEEGTWPWTKVYDEIEICKIPVKLEVGHFVQIIDCGDLEMKLEQVPCNTIGKGGGDFPCYEDCVTFFARGNFPATFGADFNGSGSVGLGGHNLSWDADRDTILGDGSSEELKLCMTAWGVQLWNAGQTSGWVTVGEIVITVKPNDVYYPGG